MPPFALVLFKFQGNDFLCDFEVGAHNGATAAREFPVVWIVGFFGKPLDLKLFKLLCLFFGGKGNKRAGLGMVAVFNQIILLNDFNRKVAAHKRDFAVCE